MELIKLNNGYEIPYTGLGVFQITNQDVCEESVLSALKIGYRMIDTAACYGNEQAVGDAVKKSGVPREEITLVSKVWIQDMGYEKTMASFQKTLHNLKTDYLDMYLIHMPYGDYYGSWRAMETLLEKGNVKAIGVCNFLEDRLVDLILHNKISPAVNQVELHPFCQQQRLRKVMAKYKIIPMAWAPFAEGNREIFRNETLKRIGNQYGKTPAQVILRWLRQNDIIQIPKSVHENRQSENFEINDFCLSESDMKLIEKLDDGRSLILDITSMDEVYRLNDIQFEQS